MSKKLIGYILVGFFVEVVVLNFIGMFFGWDDGKMHWGISLFTLAFFNIPIIGIKLIED